MKARKKEVYVFGHKSPDTDSICSAIGYAYLKNKLLEKMLTEQRKELQQYFPSNPKEFIYTARRAGQINLETEYVLKRFKHKVPSYVNDVRPQVKDINFRKLDGIKADVSLKQAWTTMKQVNVATMPVVLDDGTLEGIITTGDIAKAYMAVLDNKVLAKGNTPLVNILDALEGDLLVGDVGQHVNKGKVLIAAANMDIVRGYAQEDDVVILGNRYEAQLCAIENKASCIIVCEGATVSRTIRKLAEEHHCSVISTKHDTYTVARLINQSVPVGYFMKSENIISFKTYDYVEDIKSIMTKSRHRDFPILTKDRKFIGMISRRALISMPLKKVILVDHNELDQGVEGLRNAEVMEIIDHHKLGTVETLKPAYVRSQPVGCTATIIYQMFIENGIEIPKNIAGLLCSAIISDTLYYRSPTCTKDDEVAMEALGRIAGEDTNVLAEEIFKAGSNLKGKSMEELFYQDFKKFTANGINFGVGQVMSMSKDDLESIQESMNDYLEKVKENHDVEMVFFMMTSIMDESTMLLYAGKNAREVAESAFNGKVQNQGIELAGVVSRKKQLIPSLMATLQQ